MQICEMHTHLHLTLSMCLCACVRVLSLLLVERGLDPSLAEHNMPCLSKQCRSRSVGF